MTDDTRSVEQVCKDYLGHPELLKGCNLFVQAVCGAFGYGTLFSKGDNADAMIAKLNSPPFHNLKTDKKAAADQADKGMLVLGGLTLADMKAATPSGHRQPTMGHIVVIAPGGLCRPTTFKLANGDPWEAAGGYPYCYGGAAQAVYRIAAKLTISCVMPRASRDKTQYAWLDIPKAGS